MKRLLVVILLMLMVVPALEARRKTKKAGVLKDNIYTDNYYGFQLTLRDDWKVKIYKEKSKFRLMMSQNDPDIPPRYMNAEDYTKVPRLIIYADTTTMGEFAFLDSLLSDTYESKQKKEILREFEILQPAYNEGGGYRRETITKLRKTHKIGKDRAVIWQGGAKYKKEISESASSVGGKRVTGGYSGAVVIDKNGKKVIAFHLICEEEFFGSILEQVKEVVSTLIWIESEEKK